MRNWLLLWTGVFLLAVDASLSANVLGIFSFPGVSNFRFNRAILKSLHADGHRITFLTTFASEVEALQNFTVVDVSGGIPNLVGGFSPSTFASYTTRERMQFLFTQEEKYCAEIMKTLTVKDALSSKIKFDVMFTQIMFIPQCSLKIAEILRIPLIGTVAFNREMPILDTGNPLNPSVFPHPLSEFEERMSFVQRLKNTYYYILSRLFDDTTIQPRVIKFCRQHFPELPAPPKISPSLVFVNSHSSLLPRPLVPNFIEVAGIHIHPAKPLSPTLKKFVDEAEHGVILFAFGSVVSPSQIPHKVIAAFVEAFASIPQRVIWKYDQVLEKLSENVLLVNWIPQRDILEHKNVVAFISHCGLSGMLEAIHTGTPVIAAPLFGDQPSNALFLQRSGVAVPISPYSASKEEILDALKAIVNDTRYRENMLKLSQRFKDRPLTPQQSIKYWTEYVIRHKGALHMRTVAADMPLYQYLLLDVLLFVCSVAALIFYVLYFVVATACRLKSQPDIETHKKKE